MTEPACPRKTMQESTGQDATTAVTTERGESADVALSFSWNLTHPDRNGDLWDVWSLVHIASSAALTLLFGPVIAFIITFLWEPFELFVLSPLLARFGVRFGYESWQNSLADVAFNAIGIAAAWLLVLPYWNPFGV
jgi:hypothetical protein